MELSAYLTIVRRWWWTLLVAIWVAGLSGYLIASRLEPIYETQTRVLVGPMSSDLDTLRAAGQLAQTYAALAVSQPTLSHVIDEVGVDLTPTELAEFVTAQADAETRLLTIDVNAGTPELAVQIGDSIAGRLQALAQSGPVLPEGQITIVDPPVTPLEPIAPQVSLIVVLAALAGLVGALVLVVLIDYFSDTINVRRDLAQFDVPFLGLVRRGPRGRHGAEPLVVREAPTSNTANDYRLIAASFAYDDSAAGKSILVVGVHSSDAPGYAAANLAAAVNLLGKRVLLIDADGTRRVVTQLFGLAERPGLVEALARPVGDRLDSSAKWGVDAVGFGRAASAGIGEDLDPDQVEPFLAHAEAGYDLVVINAPPIQDDVSAILWARVADETVVVVQRDRTKRRDLRHLLDALEQVEARRVSLLLLEDGQVGPRPKPVPADATPQAQPVVSGRKGR